MSGARHEDDLEQAVDALYTVPTSEFTERRDALAKKLAAAGDKDAAKAVKSRKKPSAIAFVLNQLARRHPEDVATLVDAGRDLARAQRSALRGESGGGDKLREAMARQRDVIRDLSQKVSALLREEAAPKSALLDGVVRALHAALVDPALGEALEQGRLETAPAVGGGGFSTTTGDEQADHDIVEAAKTKPPREKETPHHAPHEAKRATAHEPTDTKRAAAAKEEAEAKRAQKEAAAKKEAEAKQAAAEREAARARVAEAEHEAAKAEKEAERLEKRAKTANDEAAAAVGRAEAATTHAKAAAKEAEAARASARHARDKVTKLEKTLERG